MAVHGTPSGEESVPLSAAQVPRPSGARWMAPAFAAGSTCFLIGPFPGSLALIGPVADSLTLFVGSLLFTVGGALQVWLATAERGDTGTGRAAWQTATIQFAGTIFFNITTFRALQTALSDPGYDRLVWRPDAFGSVCFLISGLIAYAASPRHGPLPAHGAAGWWQPGINLLGCVFFGIAAIAGHVVPPTGSMLDLAAANWTTAAGAACFLVCAVAGLVGGDEAEPHAAPHDRPGHLRRRVGRRSRPGRPGRRMPAERRCSHMAGRRRAR